MFNGNRIVTGLFAGTAVLIAASAANAQAPSAMDKQFMVKLCQGNHAEVAAGKIALKNSQDAKVRGVAQTIITEHTANDAKLHTLAEKYSVRLPNQPDAKHKAMAKKLAVTRGKAFDNAYISGQMKDHGNTISLLRMEMEKGRNSEVRSFATETLGGVLAHNDTIHSVAGTSANKMMSKMKAGNNMSGMSSAGSSSKPMSKMNKMDGSKMNGSMGTPKPATGGSFTPAPRTSPIPSASPAPGIN
ncbi:MAG: DUF4142 domain-containing protein [Akkermansiaceae bacterium]|nr:DUF4142 domain-containing protein [Armatimonadota bacterium]